MANDKKFIVKNGLLTPQNAVIGSTTDTGEKLQVTGSTKLSGIVDITQSTAASPSLTVQNTGGYLQNSVVASFEGDSDSLQITNSGQGDYTLSNSQQDNGITFYDNTSGIRILYNGTPRLDINSTGNKFYGLATTNIDGNRILTTADEGPGNGLDADTVDGLQASQFLRSDVDDTAAGNIIIQQDLTVNQNVIVDGDLTVSGNTTTVNTEQILLADNIITLNSNYTGSSPSENSGIEIERGTLDNPKVLWDESNDYWKLINGTLTDLGRIITTADEGPGNGFDADTVDGLEAFQFLRSDVDDTANGNITILGNLIVGDDNGGAEIVLDGSGQDRRIYSNSGEIGFLDSTFNYAAKSDTNNNWIVDNDVRAGQDVDADRNVIASVDVRADTGNITALQGNIVATLGNISALDGDVIGQRFIDVDNASYFLNPADFSQLHSIGLDDDLYHNGDSDTKLSFSTDDISLQTGGSERLGIQNTSVSSSVDFYAPNIVVNDAIIHNNDTDTQITFADNEVDIDTGGSTRLTANNSGVFVDNLTASGDISAGGDISGGTGTFTGDVTAARFVDADDTNYFADPAGSSEFHDLQIDDYLKHRGNTTTYLGFPADNNIRFATDGTERVLIDTTYVTSSLDGIFPNLFADRYYDSTNATYYGDFASTSRINDISLVGEIIHDGDTNTLIHFNASDSVEVQTGGAQRLLINNSYVLAKDQMRSPIYYDNDNTNYYGNFSATSNMASINIDSYIRHRGDTNTYLGFDGNDSITFVTGGTERVNITDTNTTFYQPVVVQGDIQADRFVDRQDTAYYLNPADASLSAVLNGGVRIGNSANYTRYADSSGSGGIALLSASDLSSGTNPFIAVSGNYSGAYGLLYLNRIDPTSNPTNGGNTYINFQVDGAAGASIRGDSSGNMYNVLRAGTNWGFWNSGYTEVLIADDSGNVMVNAGASPTYASMDNTPLVGSITNNKLHVSGSIQLNSNDDAIVFGRGTSTFLKDEELGFGWGSGWYMTDASYLRVRNNTTVYSTGVADFNQFRSYQNTAYYVDPDGDSQLNTVDIDDYVRHRGDLNTFIGFPANDQVRISTNNNARINITNSSTRVRQKLEVYGSGIELQKNSNGDGVGLLVTDRHTSEWSWDQEGNILFYHSDGAITTGSNAAWLYTSSEAITHHVFGTARGGTVAGGNVIPQVTNTGTLGLSTYRWGTIYAQTGDFSSNVTGGDAYFNRYYDRQDNAYYLDPNGTSIIKNIQLTDAGADTYIQFGPGVPANDDAHIEWKGASNGGYLRFSTSDDNGTEFMQFGDYDSTNRTGAFTEWAKLNRDYLYHTSDIRAPIFYDHNNTSWYVDPASTSKLNEIILDTNVVRLRGATGNYGSFEIDGGGSGGYEGFSIGGRSVFMHDNADTTGVYNDVDNEWFWYAERNGPMRLMHNGTERARTENGYFLANQQIRSPIFYDSNDTGYFVNPNSNTRLNTIQALRYYFNHNTTYYMDQASGNYGSVKTGGATGGWSGYAIEDWWVFMADGVETSGIYNDTDNEWAFLARRNAEVELYYNGGIQAETGSGYFLANNQMRAPIYYDSQNTTYFLDPAAGNTSRALRINGRIYRDGFASGNGENNVLLDTQDRTHWIWRTATDWGIMWAGDTNPYRSHFSTSNPNELVFIGNGNLRASIDLDNGNAYFQGEIFASNYNLNGGNENISLNPSYTRGHLDETLFDGTKYFEKRVIQTMQGAENSTTTTTSEFVKSSDAPGGSSYVLRTSAYRDFYSDYIEVEPGEEVFGEIHARRVSGSGGLLYYGIERFDKDKKPIAGNTGTTYFVVSANNVTSTSWQTFRSHTTIPSSHTPYNGSDGGGVRYVRLRILYNYNSGGALREFTAPVLKRVNAFSNIRTDYDIWGSVFRDVNNSAYYLDMDSVSYLNDIRPNIMYDRNDTNYYVNPATGFRLKGSNGSAVIQGSWPQLRIAQDDGTADASINYDAGSSYRKWNVGPGAGASEGDEFGFAIYANTRGTLYGTPLRINALTGRVQVGDRDGPRYLLDVAGTGYANSDFRAPIFYDSNDTAYYTNPNSSSRFHNVEIRNYGLRLARNYTHNGIWFNGGTDQNHVLWNTYYGGPAGRGGAGAGRDGIRWNTYGGIELRGGSNGAYNLIIANNSSGGSNNHTVELYAHNVKQFETESGYALAPNQMRSPRFYDSNDTAYFGDFASESRFADLRIEKTQADAVLKVTRTGSAPGNYKTAIFSNQYGNHSWGVVAEVRVDGVSGTDKPAILYSSGQVGTTWTTGFKRTDSDFAIVENRGYRNGGWGTPRLTISPGGNTTISGGLYAPIYYDSDDTAYYLDPTGDTKIRRLYIWQDKVWDTSLGNATDSGYLNLGWRVMNQGRKVYADEEFSDGTNGTSIYNNAGGSALTRARITDAAAPNESGVIYRYTRTNSSNGTSPGYGGFYFAIGTARNRTIVCRWRARMPSGKQFNFASNAYGSNANSYWLTDNVGTGKYEEYAYVVRCGNGGSFSSTMFFYVTGGSSSGTQFDLATATCYIDTDHDLQQARRYWANRDVRGDVFYDVNNTGYYADPNSTSQFRRIDLNSELRNESGAPHYFYTGAGNLRGYIRATDTNDSHLHIATSGGEDIKFSDGGFTSAWNMIIRGNGQTLISSRIDTPIMYDRNDTGYYVDPNSSSQFRRVYANDWFRPQGNTGVYFESYGRGLWAPESEGNSYGNVATYGGGRNGWRGWGVGSRHVLMSTGGDNLGLHDNSRGWLYYWNGSYTRFQYGYTRMDGSARSPIFYDLDNTAYYFNGASDNSTRMRGISNEAMAFQALPGHTRNSGEYYRARPRITGDTNYWTGAMGWGRVDMNAVATWGSGFIDSWSNPANQPSGTSHWVGVQAFHYRSSNTRGYGWQMVGGPVTNLRFRSSWSGWRSWRTIPILDENSTNGGAMYAGIYYDSNDTNYYANPNSTSRFYRQEIVNELHVSTGNGTGVGIRLADDGDIVDNNDGWATMRFSNGVIVTRGNRTNGARAYIGSDGNTQATSSLRAPIFYDRNDTGYRMDPNSTSNEALRIRGGTLHGPNPSWGRYLAVGTNGHWSGSFASVATTNGNLHLDSQSGRDLYLQWYVGRTVYVSGAIQATIYYDRNSTGYYVDPASTSRMNQVNPNRINSPYAGGNSGITRSSSPYSFGFQENGGWGFPYPDLVLQYHTGMSFAGNPSYGGMRFFNDYNSGTVRFQINGSSSYTFANTWLQVGGGGVGIYDGYNGAHFYPNNATNYGSWNFLGSRSGWRGIAFSDAGYDPHMMWDSSGNGGWYHEDLGRWLLYHSRSRNCMGVGSSSTVSGYQMRVNGSLYANGNIVAYSDRRKKKNIVTIDDALDKVLQLRGVYYERIEDETTDDRDILFKGRQLGMIAQEVEDIVPEVVSYSEEVDEYGLDYPKMVGLLVEATKGQQEIINNQQNQINELKELVNKLMEKL